PPLCQHTRRQPLLDEADDAPVPNPMLDKPDQPSMRHVVEKALDVRGQSPVHALPMDANHHCIQGVMWTPPWSESRRKPPELFLPDARKDPGGHTLDPFV